MLRIWIVVIQASKRPNWSMRNMTFHVLNINMFLVVVDMQHSLHVLITGEYTKNLEQVIFNYILTWN